MRNSRVKHSAHRSDWGWDTGRRKKQKQVKPIGQNGIKNKAKQDTGKKDKQKIKIKHKKNGLIYK